MTLRVQKPVRRAKIPAGAPNRGSLHVRRQHVISEVSEALSSDGGLPLVGLVGASGSGKTTAAAQVIWNFGVLRAFPGGIVWISGKNGGQERLPTFMLAFARKVYMDIFHGRGDPPSSSDDAITYVKKRMEHLLIEGEGSKCLVVADGVLETEVVSQLLQTGMRILLTTRDEKLVTDARGKAVIVDKLSIYEAELLLKEAAALSPRTRLPDAALVLIELCDRVAMDMAIVGRWPTVQRSREDESWSTAIRKIRAEMEEVSLHSEIDVVGDPRAIRREAILRADFDELAARSGDERVPRLCISLGLLPDGYAFTVTEAAKLLHDREPTAEDEASAAGVVGVLKRWNVLHAEGKYFFMHEAHSRFARENLLKRRDIRGTAEHRWARHIASMDVPPGGGSEVEKLLRQAVKIPEAALGLVNNGLQVTTVTLFELASSACLARSVCDRQEGRLEAAQELLTECLRVHETKRGKNHRGLAQFLHELGVCAREGGQQKEAEAFFRRCLEIKEKQRRPVDAHIITTLHELIVCVRDCVRAGGGAPARGGAAGKTGGSVEPLH